MSKIKIPRKLKKHANKILDKTWKNFPNVPKLMRYIQRANLKKNIM